VKYLYVIKRGFTIGIQETKQEAMQRIPNTTMLHEFMIPGEYYDASMKALRDAVKQKHQGKFRSVCETAAFKSLNTALQQ
jgi:hypothetical protein